MHIEKGIIRCEGLERQTVLSPSVSVIVVTPSGNRRKFHMNTLFPGYKIRAARIEDLVTLAEIERAAATLFRKLPTPSRSTDYGVGFQ
jgi:hypothetical protein